MIKFNVGDKVRRVYGTSGGMRTGDIGTVKEILNEGWMFLVEYADKHAIDKFELVEEGKPKTLTIEEKIDIVNEKLNKMMAKNNGHDLERLKREEKDRLSIIKDCQRYLNDAWKRYKDTMIKIKVANEEVKKDFKDDIQAMFDNKYVTDVMYNEKYNQEIHVITDYIDIYDENGNKFKGNKYDLGFNFSDMTCYIEGLDSDYCRQSYWTESDPHPHVDGDSGEACWGSAGSMLTENMNNYELYASFIVVLNFLQQVNTSDAAGEYIRNWDCIDEEGNELNNPYEEYFIECVCCDYEMREEDAYTCEDCGDKVCEDHKYWVDKHGKYVCEGCWEDEYISCDCCWEGLRYEDTTEVEGRRFCEDCIEEYAHKCNECGEYFKTNNMNKIHDNWYCGCCSEKLFEECYECGRLLKKEEVSTCGECFDTYCSSCAEDIITEKEGA